MNLFALVGREARHELIKHVVVALAFVLLDDARLLEKVDVDTGTHHLEGTIELNFDELAETRRVVVARRLRVAEGLEKRVRGEHLGGDLVLVPRFAHDREVLHHDLNRLGLACSTLARDEDRLVATIVNNVLVCILGDRVDVWWLVTELLATVLDQEALFIERLAHLPAEWVDSDAYLARVRVDVIF